MCVVDACECEGVGEVVDGIAGRCVQREQCTGKSTWFIGRHYGSYVLLQSLNHHRINNHDHKHYYTYSDTVGI